MIESIISAILWFLAGVGVTVFACFLFVRWSWKEIGGAEGAREHKDEIIDNTADFLSPYLETIRTSKGLRNTIPLPFWPIFLLYKTAGR